MQPPRREPARVSEGSSNIDDSAFLLQDFNPSGIFGDYVKCYQFSSTVDFEVSRGIYLFVLKDIDNKGEILFPFLTVK